MRLVSLVPLLLAAGSALAAFQPQPAHAGNETSPCSTSLKASGYTIRDIDNHGWYDQIDVTARDGRRLELDVRRSDCVIMRQETD